MKKTLLLSVICSIAYFSNAQVNPHAIGVRGIGYGGEISYQHGIGSSNRLELDLGLWNRAYRDFTLTGVYHWVFNIDGGFNWFVGVGGQVGEHRDRKNKDYGGLTLGVAGQIGIEFDFNAVGAPILLGLDYRPVIPVIGRYRDWWYGSGTGLSIRYTF